MIIAEPLKYAPFEWLDHVQREGLVFARPILEDLGISPIQQTRFDSQEVAAHLASTRDEPAVADPLGFLQSALGWPVSRLAGAPGGPSLPELATLALPELDTVLSADLALIDTRAEDRVLLLVRSEDPGIDPDARGALDGWEASPQQRFERLLRESGVEAGILFSDLQLRLVYAPRGETAGWIGWPLHDLNSVAGRSMLGGLKSALGTDRLFTAPANMRLHAVLKASREAQAIVSITLAEQVLGALHELLRGFLADDDARELIETLADEDPDQLYEGLLTVLLRLVFVLFAEDRELLPSMTEDSARILYDENYSARGLYDRLLEDRALNPDTMDERVGGWGRLLALFGMIHSGHRSGFIRSRGGRLFDPDVFLFLQGRTAKDDKARVLRISDDCILNVLEGLLSLKGERLSYKALDVEQIGSVYETVMGFRVERASGPMLAIKAGKNNKTPVYVDLDALLVRKPADRKKYLKEECQRSNLTKRQEDGLKNATSVETLAAALDAIVDERASPHKRAAPKGTPILQPTDERRESGSHYTPRSLTQPIVAEALEPVLLHLGDTPTPDQILDIKVCDPAMGSGAFLVETCRALAAQLTRAWERNPSLRPTLPQDEDEDLHARRLVAQRCLYGVDRNPMAVDLARLSLWLATLARDHEFTFLDHALKSGDSLVGLTAAEIGTLTWDPKISKPLLIGHIKERLEKWREGRQAIRSAPDDVALALQEVRLREAERSLSTIRNVGDALVSTFFAAAKATARKKELQAFQVAFTERRADAWDLAARLAAELRTGEHPIAPFHWQIEFPEVFGSDNPGFDLIVGNPPFLGGRSISTVNGESYSTWLAYRNTGSQKSADLGAFFFRQSEFLLRRGAAFGLVASNTIKQGVTRESGLLPMISGGTVIYRAKPRMKWPGEAAVVVSVVHAVKRPGNRQIPSLLIDGRPAKRISAFLVDGTNDASPIPLKNNEGMAFIGTSVLGMGFTFDDVGAAKGTASWLEEMDRLIAEDPRNAERIRPYLGGEEVNNDLRHYHRRYVIDFEDFPLRKSTDLSSWLSMSDKVRDSHFQNGIVPSDYPGPVAADWPDLVAVLEKLVRPERLKSKSKEVRAYAWWKHWRPRPDLNQVLSNAQNAMVLSRVSPHLSIAKTRTQTNRHIISFADSCVVFAKYSDEGFATLQSRPHEIWARFFSSSMKDDLRYAPSDCFATFPFPEIQDGSADLRAAGQSYNDLRANLMLDTEKGLTPTYNRFHDPYDADPQIQRLRDLHADMDRAVLRAYDWDDLAEAANPVFLTEETETEFTYQGRLFWPSDFRDEVLARLLDLNRARHAAEANEGIAIATAPDAPHSAAQSGKRPKQNTLDIGEGPLFDRTIK
ncbi:Eco57I restriction-modification methylase domain-containing protein [Yoonia vestfoldensis]|uniref:Eco57I restriction-modification methylase domain-containing protein n=1 Tax=Yoonia vestfoldensis TaxID=245188 RepID=UPI00037A7E2E|nr:DNA methyltransferase [Yoonia vestfoldensis]